MLSRPWSLILFVACACGTPAAGPGAPTPAADAGGPACPDAAAWAAALAPNVDGLLYPSESDRPLEPVWWASAASAGALDQALVRSLAGFDAAAVTETRGYDAWFDRVAVAQDWMDDGQKAAAARFATLRAFLDTKLVEKVVVRVGEVEIHVFVVGRDACGNVAGLRTVAIET